MRQYEYLKDPQFLKYVDELQAKEQYVRIVVLDWKTEKPLGEIQGKTSAGSNNLNGSSSVRRTASLTLVADDEIYDITNIKNLVSINKKIKLEVGFKNTTSWYKQYEKIWFPLGVYIIKTASISHNTSGINISLSLNDKMSLLNGDVGGIIPAVTIFSSMDVVNEKGEMVEEKILIVDIIRNLVHEFGGIELGKIIINDIPLVANEIIKWTSDKDLYLINTNGKYEFTTNKPEAGVEYIVKKYGEDIGYKERPFTYPASSDKPLSCAAGEAVTAVLDKIKNTLGNFEYYFDVWGNFIFQESKNYLNNSQASQATKEGIDPTGYLINRSRASSVYTFDDAKLIASYSNNPQFQNIKNDFIVWGEKTTKSGVKTPIRYHLAIDQKPEPGNFYVVKVSKNNLGIKSYQKANIVFCNCPIEKLREWLDDNKIAKDPNIYYCCKINYVARVMVYDAVNDKFTELNDRVNPIKVIKTNDWRSELFMQGLFNTDRLAKVDYYFKELVEEWPKVYDMAAEPAVKKYNSDGTIASWEYHESGLPVWQGKFIGDYYNLDYYLDFIDTSAAIGQFSVDTIGRRTKVVNDKNVNCIFSSPIPDPGLYIIEDRQADTALLEYDCKIKGYPYVLVKSELYETMTTGGGRNSAYEKIRNLLYQNTSYNESISISAIPIFYIEPNTRITVYNKKAGIKGDYVIKTISLPLAVNGMMNISCTKALERI